MQAKTVSTVVAVFSKEADARDAMNELKSNGFNAGDIFLSSAASTGRTDTVRTTGQEHHEGGISGWFKSLFGEDDTADRPYYENAVNSGNCVLSVEVNDQNMERAADILDRHSPVDVHTEAGDRGSAVEGTDTNFRAADTRAKNTRENNESTQAIPVIEEQLRVGKRAILRGGVRVYSRVIEEPVEENVKLREEHVTVERSPVNRATTNDATLRAGQEQVIEMKEYAEEAVVDKQSRVVEEVRVRKDATERNETIRDTVRRTEVDVENLKDESSRDRKAGKGVNDFAAPSATADIRTDYLGSPMDDSNYEEDFRRDYNQRYAGTGDAYDMYAPAYQYGYQMRNDPRYTGRNWDDVESDLRSDYGRRYPSSTWERVKDSVRYGWDKVTGKTSAATRGR